jgi:hypothetical protein
MSEPLLRGVIVDGPDGAGKTTLIKKLKEALAGRGWDVLQMGHKPGDQFKRYMTVYLAADRLLLDRGHFSEVVYGNLSRNGRHFAPWECAMLDDIVRREFVTVLCTGPADVLRTRQVARDWRRMYAAFDDTLREHLADRSLANAQMEFARIVAPIADVVCEALKDSDLDRAVEAVLDRVRVRRSSLCDAPREAEAWAADAEIVLLDGPPSPHRTALAARLGRALGGWQVVSSHHEYTCAPFARVMSEYLAASQVVFEGGHFADLVYGRGDDVRQTLSTSEVAYLCQYVSARGVVVLCESAAAGAAHAHIAFRELLHQSNVPFSTVRLDDASDVEDAIASIAARTLGAVPTAPGR